VEERKVLRDGGKPNIASELQVMLGAAPHGGAEWSVGSYGEI